MPREKKIDYFVIINAENKALAVYGEALEEEARTKTEELLKDDKLASFGVFLVRVRSSAGQIRIGTPITTAMITRKIYVSILDPHKDYSCRAEDAPKIFDWLKNRGGIAVWKSVNLSNPTGSWTAPYLDDKGEVKVKPTWQADSKPARIITDPAEVWVMVPKEVKRFRIAIRAGALGMSFKLTDASSRKVEKAVAAEGIGAWYEFDYTTQEAIIFVAEREQRITEYFAKEGS